MATQPRKTTSLSFDQIEQVAGNVPGQMDAYRAGELDGLSRVKRAKLVQARRERARLEAKHGADHRLVAEADRRMANEHRVLVNARMERDRIGTPALERAEGEWLLHGYVRTRDGLAVGNATVAIYPDAEGQQDALVDTKSDSKGYFKISFADVPQKDSGLSSGESTERPQEEAELEAGGLHINTNMNTLNSRRAALSEEGLQRLDTGLRVNSVIRERFTRQAYYVGGRPSGGTLTMVDKAFYPAPSMIAYRDIILADSGLAGDACRLRTQFLGNSATRELHNLKNEKPGCQLAAMRPDHRVYFRNEAEAERVGYDFCAYCYGKARSKR
jgi:hypothetical protein